MKGYSIEFDPKSCASARLEGVDASYKDLSEVCGRIRRKNSAWALTFLEKAAAMEIPVLYRTHNTKLGHRRELLAEDPDGLHQRIDPFERLQPAHEH